MTVVEGLLMLFNFVAILDIILILKHLYAEDMQINWKVFWGSAIIYYSINLVLIYLAIQKMVSHEMSMWCTYGYIFVLVLMFSKKHRVRNLLLVLPAVLVYLQWTQVIALLEHLFGLEKYYIYVQADKLTPLYFVQDISLLLILLYLERRSKKEYSVRLTLGEGIFVTLFCLFGSVLVELFHMIEEKMESTVFSACWSLFILAVHVAVVYAVVHRKRAKHYGELSENYRRQLDEEYEYFQAYKNQNKDIAKFRHDWNNHCMLLQAMLQEEKYEKAAEYFGKLSAGKVNPVRKVITGSEAVDMVLAIKQNILEQENILVSYEGEAIDLSFMEHVDICTIFSNLVDNAIESCRQVAGKRYLTIKMTQNENLLLLVLENSAKERQSISEGDIPESTKENKKLHGFGLTNVMEIVNKYSGEMEVKQQKDTFIVRLLFPREKKVTME